MELKYCAQHRLRQSPGRSTAWLTHGATAPGSLDSLGVIEKMITTAEEFVRLRSSELPEAYERAAHEEASVQTWNEVIENYPDYTIRSG
jgi:hypothetical protein